jgi:hypothetical protein
MALAQDEILDISSYNVHTGVVGRLAKFVALRLQYSRPFSGPLRPKSKVQKPSPAGAAGGGSKDLDGADGQEERSETADPVEPRQVLVVKTMRDGQLFLKSPLHIDFIYSMCQGNL